MDMGDLPWNIDAIAVEPWLAAQLRARDVQVISRATLAFRRRRRRIPAGEQLTNQNLWRRILAERTAAPFFSATRCKGLDGSGIVDTTRRRGFADPRVHTFMDEVL